MRPARLIAEEVLSTTDDLVRYAMEGSWSQVMETIERRRLLLRDMHADPALSKDGGLLAALTAAVAESEQVLAHVVAHAVDELGLGQLLREAAAP